MITNINIVSNVKLSSLISTCKYFKTNLGLSLTVFSHGDKVLSEKDKFLRNYHEGKKSFPYAKGNIGNIRIYVDYTIMKDEIYVYYDVEEFIIKFDNNTLKEKGIDNYLGSIIKDCDDKIETIKSQRKIENSKELMDVPKGDSNKLLNSPGMCTWEDVIAWREKKNRERFENKL